jgi:hypothetical protein
MVFEGAKEAQGVRQTQILAHRAEGGEVIIRRPRRQGGRDGQEEWKREGVGRSFTPKRRSCLL